MFRVVAQATDACDPDPAVSANINGIAVVDGQLVRLELDDDGEIEHEDNILTIQATSIVLTVSATDANGNTAIATVALAPQNDG